jgi:hypothetical protein
VYLREGTRWDSHPLIVSPALLLWPLRKCSEHPKQERRGGWTTGGNKPLVPACLDLKLGLQLQLQLELCWSCVGVLEL